MGSAGEQPIKVQLYQSKMSGIKDILFSHFLFSNCIPFLIVFTLENSYSFAIVFTCTMGLSFFDKVLTHCENSLGVLPPNLVDGHT